MNQEQKDTIREEFDSQNWCCDSIVLDAISDWWLLKLDQAYQQGAKNKVEEVRGDILNYSETRDNSEARGAIWDILELPTLKDNT